MNQYIIVRFHVTFQYTPVLENVEVNYTCLFSQLFFFCMCKCVWFVFVHALMCVGTGVCLASSHTLNTCLNNFLLLSLRQDFSTERTSFR